MTVKILTLQNGGNDGDRAGTTLRPSNSFVQVGHTSGGTVLEAWYRFPLDISLSGMTILSATLRLTEATNLVSSGSPETRIYAESSASPVAPTSGTDYTTKPVTSASVEWDLTPADGATYDSPNLKAIIQELVDNYHPTAIQILHKNDRAVTASDNYQAWRSYEGSTTAAATLTIAYEKPQPTVAPIRVIARDLFTLARQAEVVSYDSVRWTRRANEPGEWQLKIHHQMVETILQYLTPRRTVIEIRRDGVHEFAGILLKRELNDPSLENDDSWTFSGPDLSWFLNTRKVLPPSGSETDSVSAVTAEAAMIHYVANSLTAPLDATRNANAVLSGITFEAQANEGRGGTVTYNARYVILGTALKQLATAGDLLFDVEMVPGSGYRFAVDSPVDATRTSGTTPIVFATRYGNVSARTWRENLLGIPNRVLVMGQGAGTLRTVETVDLAEVGTEWLVEDTLDSRNNSSTAALQQDGTAYLTDKQTGVVSAEVQPLTVGPLQYRTDYDLGYDVTVDMGEVGQSYDKRIVEVAVDVTPGRAEDVTVTLGDTPRTSGRLLSEALTRLNRVQVA